MANPAPESRDDPAGRDWVMPLRAAPVLCPTQRHLRRPVHPIWPAAAGCPVPWIDIEAADGRVVNRHLAGRACACVAVDSVELRRAGDAVGGGRTPDESRRPSR